MIFNTLATDHGRGPQSYVGQAHLFGVYFPPTFTVYLVPIDAVAATEGRLRLEPALNNQRRRVRMAADFETRGWTIDALRDLESSTPSSRWETAQVA
jgi:hypothetical protein